MNCTLKSGGAKTKKKKERKKEINTACCGPQSLALEGGVVRAKRLRKPRVNIRTTNEDLSWSCELVTLVSSMTYFCLEMLLTPGLCGPITI